MIEIWRSGGPRGNTRAPLARPIIGDGPSLLATDVLLALRAAA